MFAYNWPGNVRELENMMKRYIVFRDPDMIGQQLLERTQTQNHRREEAEPIRRIIPIADQPRATPSLGSLEDVKRTREAEETRLILEELEANRWNRKKAARSLNM